MTRTAKRGDWVRIKNTILKVGERASNLPEVTKKVPLDMWVNGFLAVDKAEIGDEVAITTLAERTLEGIMVEIMPTHEVNYGVPQPELIEIGPEIRAILRKAR